MFFLLLCKFFYVYRQVMGKCCLKHINKRRNAERELALVKAFLLLFINPKGFAHSLVF